MNCFQCCLKVKNTHDILDFFFQGNCYSLFMFIIHQISLLAHDWSKCVTWANIREYSLIFKTACVMEKISRIINMLLENYTLLRTGNVCGQISKLIFAKWRLLFIYTENCCHTYIQKKCPVNLFLTIMVH